MTATSPVGARLSRTNRFLPLWIALAMAGGLALGSVIPGLNDFLDELKVGTVSLPIAIGLLLMMYPVLTKVRYEDLGTMRGERDRRMFGIALFLSWVVGPALMFALAWLFLADEPAYRTGVIGERLIERLTRIHLEELGRISSFVLPDACQHLVGRRAG